MALAIAPFVWGQDGFVICVEDDNGAIKTVDGHAVLFVTGMIHGTVEEMCKQVEYVFARALTHAKTVTTIIEVRHRSFRYPDMTIRAVFGFLKQYEPCIGDIHFVDMPLLMRSGFRLFALPLLPPLLRQRIKISSTTDLRSLFAAEDLLTRWGGRRSFDAVACVQWRGRVEAIDLSTVDPIRLSDDRLRDAYASLMNRARSVDDEDVVKVTGEKRGSGGLFGTLAWKRQMFYFKDDSLTYIGTKGVVTIPLKETTMEDKEDGGIVLKTTLREYELRFDASNLSRFKETLAALTSAAQKNATPSIDVD